MRRSSFQMVLLATALLANPAAWAGGRGEREFDRAREAHSDRRYEEAAAGFIAAFQAGYREETSAYNAACALARAGHRDLAFQWLEKAYEVGFDLEDYLDEDRDLRSLRSDPRFATLRSQVLGGRSSRKTREGDRAVQRLTALRQGRDARPEKYGAVAHELLDAGRYDEAAQAYLAAAAREEHQASSLYNAACARSLQGQRGPALDLLQRAVEQGFADPQHIDDDDDLDNIRNEPRFQQIRALAVELDVPGYASDGSQRERNRREWRQALPRLEGAVRNHPQLGQAWFNLGLAYIALGRGDQAVAPFTRSLELGYHKSSSTYNVACAHALAGHKDEAYAWLDRALAGGFDNWWLLRQDADLDAIRADPRFAKYLELARAHERDHWGDDK